MWYYSKEQKKLLVDPAQTWDNVLRHRQRVQSMQEESKRAYEFWRTQLIRNPMNTKVQRNAIYSLRVNKQKMADTLLGLRKAFYFHDLHVNDPPKEVPCD